MSTASSIEWTDTTWNPVAGCTPNSPGCLNCYAATMANRLDGMGQAKYRGLTVLHNGRHTFNGTVTLSPDDLPAPLTWRKPRRVFVNSMSDLFHEGVPFAYVDKVFAVMAMTPHHSYQILTKRPDRMAEYIASFEADFHRGIAEIDGEDGGYRLGAAGSTLLDGAWVWGEGKRHRRKIEKFIADTHADPSGMSDFEEADDGSDSYECKPVVWPLPNVWLGCSPVNQKTYDTYRPHMEGIRAAVRFLSLEPLLDEIDLGLPQPPGEWIDLGNGEQAFDSSGPFVDWVIVGGESGHPARPCRMDWIRSVVGQCRASGVPCFVKQLGANVLGEWEGDNKPTAWLTNIATGFDGPVDNRRKNGRWKLRDNKGGAPDEWPADLRVREFPAAVGSAPAGRA